MRRACVALLLSVLLGLAMAAETNPKREKIVEAAKKYVESWKAGNIDGVLSVYADDAKEFYSAFELVGKANIRMHIEKNIKVDVGMNVGSNVIEISDSIWLEEVGSQRVESNSFPRIRLWKLGADGSPLLWRQAVNGVNVAAPKGITKPTDEENEALCFGSDAVCGDYRKKAILKNKVVEAMANIHQGLDKDDSGEIMEQFTEDSRLLVMKEHLGGSGSISMLWMRAPSLGLKIQKIVPGNLVFLNSTLAMEEGARFQSSLGNGRLFQLWKFTPKEAPANSIPVLSSDISASQEQKNDYEVKLWRSVVLGPIPKKKKAAAAPPAPAQ